jgi:hypothetical protein
MKKLVYGIGFNDGKYKTSEKGKNLSVYKVWKSMLLRCTERFQTKYPTYLGVTCSENFKLYSYFYEWYFLQTYANKVDNNGSRYELDKDLLIKGNKLYSEDVCVLIPLRINSLIIKGNASRGEWPIGVSWHRRDNVYAARCSVGTKKLQNLGSYKTLEEAFQAYKTFKEAYIKKVANEYRGRIDERAYQALLKYEVHIDD